MRDGFSFQAGAGGIALAFVGFLHETMRQAGVKARWERRLPAGSWAKAHENTYRIGNGLAMISVHSMLGKYISIP